MQPDERDAALLFDALSAGRELESFTAGVDRAGRAGVNGSP
jgi:hypothetical protein